MPGTAATCRTPSWRHLVCLMAVLAATNAGAHDAGLTRDQIAAAVATQMPAMSACYDAAVERDPRIEGTVTMRFVIAPDGSVMLERPIKPKPGRTELKDLVAVDCVRSVIRETRFPKTGGIPVTVSYPFVFSPRSHASGSWLSCNIAEIILAPWNQAATKSAEAPTTLAEKCDWDDEEACFQIGLKYHKGDLADDASKLTVIRHYKKACELYYSNACNNLAVAILAGLQGTERVDARAAAYFEKGCVLGHLSACTSLGSRLLAGKGVAKDAQRGRHLLEDSCRLGEAAGCTELGNKLLPVEPDYANVLFRKACDLAADECDPALRAGLIPTELQPSIRARTEEKCRVGNPLIVTDDCLVAGIMHACGLGGVRDRQQAQALMKRACEPSRKSHACGFFAELLIEDGDLDGAMAAATTACDAGGFIGCSQLATLAKTPHEQQALTRKACEMGHRRACENPDGVKNFALDICVGLDELK